MFYTYAHYTPSGELFYIGKGQGGRSKRTQSRSEFWRNKVNKHGGFKDEILAMWKTEKEAFEHEKLLIMCFEGSLVNLTKGGEGASGFKHTPESLQKMSTFRKSIWDNMTDANRQDHANRVKKQKTGHKLTVEHKRHISQSLQRKVLCNTTNQVFESVKDAAKFAGCTSSNLVNCCKGKIKKAKGYVFSYVNA